MLATSAPALPKVLFLGTYGAYSRTVLAALIAAGAPICGFLMVTSPRQRPIVKQRHPPQAAAGEDELHLFTAARLHNTLELAWQHQIPVYEVGRIGSPATRKLVKTLAPDVACVACFSHKIPPTLLNVPRYGFLNVHPSQLPAFRGPDPIFWQLQAGVDFAVTVHWMNANWDSGDIAAQAPLILPDGIGRDEIELRCAELGGQLLVDVLHAVGRGQPPRTPQSGRGSYQSWPRSADFAIQPSWSARRAYNFMRGTAEHYAFYSVKIGEEEFYLTRAVAVLPDQQIERPYLRDEKTFFLQCSPGILCAEAFR